MKLILAGATMACAIGLSGCALFGLGEEAAAPAVTAPAALPPPAATALPPPSSVATPPPATPAAPAPAEPELPDRPLEPGELRCIPPWVLKELQTPAGKEYRCVPP